MCTLAPLFIFVYFECATNHRQVVMISGVGVEEYSGIPIVPKWLLLI